MFFLRYWRSPRRRTDAMIAAVMMNNEGNYTFDLKPFNPLKTLGLNLFP
jgi:hypothetical protein